MSLTVAGRAIVLLGGVEDARMKSGLESYVGRTGDDVDLIAQRPLRDTSLDASILAHDGSVQTRSTRGISGLSVLAMTGIL